MNKSDKHDNKSSTVDVEAQLQKLEIYTPRPGDFKVPKRPSPAREDRGKSKLSQLKPDPNMR